MKKIILLAILMAAFSAFAAETAETPGDPSGNDLNPIIRGLNLGMEGGIAGYIGKAGEHSDKIASVFNLKIGYDFKIGKVKIGPDLKIGIMQLNADQKEGSPFVEDYAPLVPGLDIPVTYLVTDRWEVGGNISADFYMLANAKEKVTDPEDKTKNMFIGIGFGFYTEYYTYARHFSIGLSTEFNYIVGFEGMSVTVLPFIKYTFGLGSKS